MKLLMIVVTFFMMLLSLNCMADNSANLIKCAEYKDNLVRLSCYDDIAKLLHKNDNEPMQINNLKVNDLISSATSSSTLSGKPSIKAVSIAGNPLSKEKVNSVKKNTATRTVQNFGSESIEAKADQQINELNQVVFTIKSLKKTVYGRWNIIFNNDQVWKQVSSDAIRLVVGNKVEVSKAALGSYKLKKIGSNRSIRVKRSK